MREPDGRVSGRVSKVSQNLRKNRECQERKKERKRDVILAIFIHQSLVFLKKKKRNSKYQLSRVDNVDISPDNVDIPGKPEINL